MSIEETNYLNDFRVIASQEKPWWIAESPDGDYVVVQIPTEDYTILEEHGYDPHDFASGQERPTIRGEYVVTDKDCPVCEGHGVLWRHKVMQGVQLTPDGKQTRPSPFRVGGQPSSYEREFEDDPSAFKHLACYSATCEGGKLMEFRFFPDGEERPNPKLEDRVYRPFRAVAWPVIHDVCPVCDGKGHHVNPSVDAGGLTREDFDRDPDFEEAYFSGAFDVTCYGCQGKRTIPRVDEDALGPEDKVLFERWHAWRAEIEREEEAYRAVCRAERRMGY